MKGLIPLLIILIIGPIVSAASINNTLINLTEANSTIEIYTCTWTFYNLSWNATDLTIINLTVDNPPHSTPINITFSEENKKYTCNTFPYTTPITPPTANTTEYQNACDKTMEASTKLIQTIKIAVPIIIAALIIGLLTMAYYGVYFDWEAIIGVLFSIMVIAIALAFYSYILAGAC